MSDLSKKRRAALARRQLAAEGIAGGGMGKSLPGVGSWWRRKRDGMRYQVRSVDERGVFLMSMASCAVCRLPLVKFWELFDEINDGDDR